MDALTYETLVARHSVNAEPYRKLPWIQGLLIAPAAGFYCLRVFMASSHWYDGDSILALAIGIFLAALSPRLAEARRLVSRLAADESKGVLLALGQLTKDAALMAFRLIPLIAGIAMFQPFSPDPVFASVSASAMLALTFIAASTATLFWATSKQWFPLVRDVVVVSFLYWFCLVIFTVVGLLGPVITYPIVGLILFILTKERVLRREGAVAQ